MLSSASPVLSSSSLPLPSSPNTGDVLRHRNKRKDDAIRRKLSHDLLRKSSKQSLRDAATSQTVHQKKAKAGTVASLRPHPAITVVESARIAQVAQLMAAKRADAVLVVSRSGHLSGILTDKDIAYRVVAEGLDCRNTTVAAVMTPQPIFVYDTDSRSEALATMTERKFRHLPVISERCPEQVDSMTEEQDGVNAMTNVVGLLDITKCVFDRMEDLEKKVNEDNNIIQAMETLERRGSLGSDHVTTVKTTHGCPELGAILSQDETHSHFVPEVTYKSNIREAAKVMKESHHTAVLIVNSNEGHEDKLGGIFTTKDVVLRVIANGLDPNTTSVVRVMTPHPDSVSVHTTILDALKKLHVGRYLHLPVTDGLTPIGLVDVQQLTMAMLTYLVKKDSLTSQTTHETGPMWTKFWNSTLQPQGFEATIPEESDRHSVASDRPSKSEKALSPSRSQMSLHSPKSMRSHRIRKPSEDAIPVAVDSIKFAETLEDGMFPFKVKDNETGRIFRLSAKYHDFQSFCDVVFKKSGVDSVTSRRFSYEDDEGDLVFVDGDKDLEEAVNVAKRCSLTRVFIFMDTPETLKKMQEHPETLSSTWVDSMHRLPMPIQVGLSAGVLVVGAWIMKRILSD